MLNYNPCCCISTNTYIVRDEIQILCRFVGELWALSYRSGTSTQFELNLSIYEPVCEEAKFRKISPIVAIQDQRIIRSRLKER